MEKIIFDLNRIKNKNVKCCLNKLCILSRNKKDILSISNFDIKSINKKTNISLFIDDFFLDFSDISMKDNFKKSNYYTNKINKRIEYIFKKIIKIKRICLKNNVTINKIIVRENNNYFIINQLDVLLTILEFDNFKEQYEYIYDKVCENLDREFFENNICDFKDNKCISRRNLECKKSQIPLIYGCCFTKGKLCEYLKNGKCSIKCLPCKLFTCRFLSKKNIKYKPNDILELKLFFNRKQKRILYNNLFYDRNEIVELLLKNK